MPQAQYRHFGCRVMDDLVYKGMRTLMLENEFLRVGVLLDKGADIFTFLHKPTDTDFLWRSPAGLRQVCGRAPGYPWYDRVYCIALEPWTSIPNNLDAAREQGLLARVEGGESLVTRLCATVITERQTVRHIGIDGQVD